MTGRPDQHLPEPSSIRSTQTELSASWPPSLTLLLSPWIKDCVLPEAQSFSAGLDPRTPSSSSSVPAPVQYGLRTLVQHSLLVRGPKEALQGSLLASRDTPRCHPHHSPASWLSLDAQIAAMLATKTPVGSDGLCRTRQRPSLGSFLSWLM